MTRRQRRQRRKLTSRERDLLAAFFCGVVAAGLFDVAATWLREHL